MDDSNVQDLTPPGENEKQMILKKIIEPAERNDKPHAGDDVVMHYVGRVVGKEEFFDSSIERGNPFKLKLGAGTVLPGWDYVIPTMRVGEKALVTFAPKFAFGAKGTAKVPPNSTVEFDVELISYRGEDVTKDKDGGVRKSILRRGNGFLTPRNESTMTLHLKCWHGDRLVEDKEHQFILSKSGGGENPVLLTAGALRGLGTMRDGEQCRLTVQANYAFGDAGYPDLDIPGGAVLVYELRLVDLQNKKQIFEMTFEERIEGANKVKAQGTEHFKAGEFKDALTCYKRGVELTDEENNTFKGDGHQREMCQLRLLCLLNCAASCLKLKRWAEAKDSCTKALSIDGDNVKALYRRAEASLGLSCPDESIADLQRVLKMEPGNKSARQRLQQAEERQKEVRHKERNLYSSIFTRMAKDADPDSQKVNVFDEAQARFEAEKAAQLAKVEQAEEAARAAAVAEAAKAADVPPNGADTG